MNPHAHLVFENENRNLYSGMVFKLLDPAAHGKGGGGGGGGGGRRQQ